MMTLIIQIFKAIILLIIGISLVFNSIRAFIETKDKTLLEILLVLLFIIIGLILCDMGIILCDIGITNFMII